jgi:hypothetical protein
MKSTILVLVIAVIVSACTGIPTGVVNPQVPSAQNISIESPDASTSQPPEQVSIPTPSLTQSNTVTLAIPETQTPEPTPTSVDTQTPTATVITEDNTIQPAGSGIIADNTSIDEFKSIPQEAVKAATAMKTLFMHQSTGNNIDFLGLQCLAGLRNDPANYPQECITYARNPYKDPNWNWQPWATPMADAIAKTDEWVSVANAQQSNYEVLGMKFCYVDGWNQDFNYYRQKMEQLEQAYPQKKFIWATSALWAKSELDSGNTPMDSCLNIQDFNQQLRAYAKANNKILYDIAAIESHDPSGSLCQSNGCEALCDAYYSGFGGGGGGHPDTEGSLRLAKGFWWLMARISGWNGD